MEQLGGEGSIQSNGTENMLKLQHEVFKSEQRLDLKNDKTKKKINKIKMLISYFICISFVNVYLDDRVRDAATNASDGESKSSCCSFSDTSGHFRKFPPSACCVFICLS